MTERVKQYYKVFGFRSSGVMRPGRAVIRGGRRLGFDEIECVVAETARGTSVGFYPVNTLQGLIYAIPFLFVYIIHLLNKIESIQKYISGDEALFGVNWPLLLTGKAELNVKFTLVLLTLAFLPFFSEVLHQRIRLANLKSRFSFYTRDAIWNTREAPPSLLALKSSRSIINHAWILAILYFATFSFIGESLSEITQLYQTTPDDLYNANANAFSLTIGLVIGLLAAEKAISTRKENGKIDKRSRVTGGLLERRIDPVLYGMQSAAYSAIIFGLFMSVTFLKGTSFDVAFQMLFFALLGGALTGLVHAEGPIWISSVYGILIFFSSLIFIFRTGEQPEYAFIVILQLFILPFPFIIYLSRSFMTVLKKEGIESYEWLYDTFPLMSLITIYTMKKHQKLAKKRYIADLEREVDISEVDNKIKIKKELLLDRNSPAHKLAMHYYELILTYTASFDDDKFIYIPTTNQLVKWWEERTKSSSNRDQEKFINFVDKLIWDPVYNPVSREIENHERTGKLMVLAIQ